MVTYEKEGIIFILLPFVCLLHVEVVVEAEMSVAESVFVLLLAVKVVVEGEVVGKSRMDVKFVCRARIQLTGETERRMNRIGQIAGRSRT